MSELDSILVDAASIVVGFAGDSIQYHPARGGISRTILAVIERSTMEVISESGSSQLVPAITLRVENSPTRGISSEELDTGGDEVTVAIRYGATPERRPIVRRISEDGGFLVVLVS